MDSQGLYSIRMRASSHGNHVSGAERIVPAERVDATVSALITRALEKGLRPDRIAVTVDELGSLTVRKLASLELVTLDARDAQAGRATASRLLEKTGISAQAAKTALELLSNGAAPSGGNMRGAMIIDSLTGKRLEPDGERGVRASRFDWSDEAAEKIDRLLSSIGLTHFRTREALALATKVAHAPGIVAELCWSDDPDYTAGYVAAPSFGYLRFPFLKQKGDGRGGRAFFVRHDGFNRDAFIRYLQEEPVLIAVPGLCRPAIDPKGFLERLMPCPIQDAF